MAARGAFKSRIQLATKYGLSIRVGHLDNKIRVVTLLAIVFHL